MSRHAATVTPSRLPLRDLFAEALSGILQRPGRSVLTMLGTVLGVGAFVAVLGLTSTTSSQIDARFNALEATTVSVADTGEGASATGSGTGTGAAAMPFPADAQQRVERLNGVVHAGTWWSLPVSGKVPLTTTPDGDPDQGLGITLQAAEPGAIAAMDPVWSAGAPYNAFHQERREHVAVLGQAAAERLGITRLDGNPAVFIGGTPYTVVGIYSSVQRRPEALLSVLIPTTTALSAFGPPDDAPRENMLIETRMGAAHLIADQVPLALRPDQPHLVGVTAPADPTSLKSSVSGDLNSLFLLLAAISLLVGAVGIANTTLVAVLERTGEIGLRRALGARPRHVAAQFLTESTTLGTLGGLVGTTLGVAAVLLVALEQQWTAVLSPWTVLPAPVIGSLVGLLAGLYPSLRAAWIEPVEALRR